jgi:hypothetical protein
LLCRWPSASVYRKAMWKAFIVSAALMLSSAAYAESGRIRRAPPSAAEAERIASEMAMNDSLLQKGTSWSPTAASSFSAGPLRMA